MDERLISLRAQLEAQRYKYRTLRSVSSAQPIPRSQQNISIDYNRDSIRNRDGIGSLSDQGSHTVLLSKTQFLRIRSLDSVQNRKAMPNQFKPKLDRFKLLQAESTRLPDIRALYPNPTEKMSYQQSLDSSIEKTSEDDVTTWHVPHNVAIAVPDDKERDCPLSRFDLLEVPPAFRMASLQSVYQFDQAITNPAEDMNRSTFHQSMNDQSNGQHVQSLSRNPEHFKCLNAAADSISCNIDKGDQNGRHTNWWDGSYDEASAHAEFQLAITNWRQIVNKSNTRPATSASCSVETQASYHTHSNCDLQIYFPSNNMSLLDRLLLRKLRQQLN